MRISWTFPAVTVVVIGSVSACSDMNDAQQVVSGAATDAEAPLTGEELLVDLPVLPLESLPAVPAPAEIAAIPPLELPTGATLRFETANEQVCFTAVTLASMR